MSSNKHEETVNDGLDLFAEELDQKLNAAAAAGCSSTLGSSTSFSCVAGTFCSFGCVGSACTAAVEVIS
ncbi:hypothetical protein [Stenotrophomonas maltophilia]|uniref:hypothetical protein n=1 Tax=Stenotrophomonas maltophilia TaxID=40324 RepID=UPI0007EEFF3D|nr:hypothetical protein [Stenotrophomonas maltophilia]OBU49732.1 hypothetical protein A9K69_19480 [Stenotrophomonas maltophilia]